MSFNQLDKERWLANRLKAHGARVFDGVTDREIRKQRIREAIERVGSSVVVGRGKNGKPMTYGECFELVFAEPLTPPATKPKAGTAPEPAQTAQDETGSGR